LKGVVDKMSEKVGEVNTTVHERFRVIGQRIQDVGDVIQKVEGQQDLMMKEFEVLTIPLPICYPKSDTEFTHHDK
jgi:hypothetical protein